MINPKDPKYQRLDRYLDTNGDGTGDKNADGDYSGAEEIFYIQPPSSRVYYLTRMIIEVEDATGMSADEYGNLNTALVNGIVVRVQDDNGTLSDMTDNLPVTTNAEWGQKCYDADMKSWGVGNDFMLARWTFERAGPYIVLNGNKNERFEVVLNDNFTGLVAHRFFVQGFY